MNILLNFLFGDIEKLQKLMNISVASCEKYLKNLDKSIVHICKTTDDHNESFYEMYQITRKYWEEGHEIVTTAMDTICVKDIEIFGKHKDFVMFWKTPIDESPLFEVYLNSDVRYFPQSMNKDLWNVGDELWQKYLSNKIDKMAWGFDQYVWNIMVWAQKPCASEFMDNSLNYQPWAEYNFRNFNIINKEEAKIFHFYSTRGYDQVMDNFERILNGQEICPPEKINC